MTQLCSQLSPLLSHVEQLVIDEYSPGQAHRVDPPQWFELFDRFPALQHLYICFGLFAQALKELMGERATEVLPTLRITFFEGSEQSRSTIRVLREDLQAFIAAHQHLNGPVDDGWD